MLGAGVALAVAWPATSWVLDPATEPGPWHLLGTLLAVLLASFALWVVVRHAPAYMAWERVRARLGLSPAPPPPGLYRRSSLFNWGLVGDGDTVLAHLDLVAQGDGSRVPAPARRAAARSAWLTLAFDIVAALALVLAGVVWLLDDPSGVQAMVAAAMASSFPVTILNAARYQDPWLRAYREHAMPVTAGGPAGSAPAPRAARTGRG